MPFSYIWSVFSTTMPTLYVVIVVRRRWRRKIRYLATFGFNRSHLTHHLHCILKFLVLNFPFCLFLFAKIRLHFRRFHFLFILWFLLDLHSFSFANVLMFSNSVSHKLSATSSAWNKVVVLRCLLVLRHFVVGSSWF